MPSPIAAYCGLYCGACVRYLETARRPPGEAPAPGAEPCRGCRSDVTSGWCAQCNLKRCAREKGLELCHQCGQFPCADWIAFRDDPRYPYHAEVGDHLRTLAEVGEAEWLRRMERKWTCSTCGTRADWYTRSCPRCAAPTPGFSRPAAG